MSNDPVPSSAISNDPVQSSTMSTDSRPPPPFMDIKPCPEQIDMCDSQNVVFGFPITNEWFFGLYDVMKRERQVREASQEFLSLVNMMGEICQSMYPEWGHISPVVVAAGNYGACTLIRIGMHGWTPPRRVIVDMAKELRKYGLVEKPGWFPGIGLKNGF